MSHGRGKSMSRSAAPLTAGLAALAALLIASSASAAPAVDEYGANLPTAGGHKSQGTGVPQAQPQQLPPSVAKRIDHASNGKELAAVATSDQLGAPKTAVSQPANTGADDGDGESFVSAAAGSLGTPLVLVLIAALALGAIAAWRLRRQGDAAR
jgi:hypothetical protein